MIKILITQRDLSVGGIQSVLINFLNNIDYSKYEVDLYLLSRNDRDKVIPSNVKVHYLNNSRINLLKKVFYPNFLYKKEIKKKIKLIEKKYHIAIAFNGYDDNADYLALESNSEKKVIFVHGNYKLRLKNDFKFKFLWRNNKLKYCYVDKIIAVSETSQQALNSLLPEYMSKTDYIFNYISIGKKIKNEILEEEIKKDSRKKVLLVGRLVASKGFMRVIDICLKLKNENILFIIVGDGPEKKKIENQVSKNRLEKNIKVLGFRKNVSEYIKVCDMLLITSYYEGFGMTLLESFKEKTPVIAPEISGIKDIYTHIAPKNAMRISKNINDELIKNILLELKNSQKNKFEFDIEEYNRKIDLQYKQIIFEELGGYNK